MAKKSEGSGKGNFMKQVQNYATDGGKFSVGSAEYKKRMAEAKATFKALQDYVSSGGRAAKGSAAYNARLAELQKTANKRRELGRNRATGSPGGSEAATRASRTPTPAQARMNRANARVNALSTAYKNQAKKIAAKKAAPPKKRNGSW